MDVIKVADISLDPPAVNFIHPPGTVFETVSLLAENTSPIDIYIQKESIEFGDVRPGKSSLKKIVDIENVGSQAVDITLEIQGTGNTSQTFFQQSLYTNNGIYDTEEVICTLVPGNNSNSITQLKVPSEWKISGVREAILIFWAEAH